MSSEAQREQELQEIAARLAVANDQLDEYRRQREQLQAILLETEIRQRELERQEILRRELREKVVPVIKMVCLCQDCPSTVVLDLSHQEEERDGYYSDDDLDLDPDGFAAEFIRNNPF